VSQLDDRPRLPPGQRETQDLPVLHVGEVQPFDRASWRLRLTGAVARPMELDWDTFEVLPRVEQVSDLHCVTKWSRLGSRWAGVSLKELLFRAELTEQATHVRFADAHGYDTSAPLEVCLREDALLATDWEGEPLSPEHGAPLRALLPGLYAWKSAKWLRSIEVMSEQRLGYWEQRGFHDGADPWREERML